MRVRVYGKAPYKAAVIHGGPGAIGSMADLAKDLSSRLSIVEPLQTKYTIGELVDELHEQVTCYFRRPVPLVGHSWGAWLCAIYAARYPQTVSKIILTSSGPLEDKYVPLIEAKRKSHFSTAEATLYDAINAQLRCGRKYYQDELLSQFGELCAQADEYAPLPPDPEMNRLTKMDAKMYTGVFSEAIAMRQSGELLRCFQEVACPICILHGIYDTHPADGILKPLAGRNIPYTYYALEQCGHTPWRERFARQKFLELLVSEIAGPSRLR